MSAIGLLLIAGVLAVLALAASAEPTIDGTIDDGEYTTMVKYDNDRYEVHWTFAGDELWMGIRAQTTGWVAIGFDPTDRMKDADMVYGWVDGSGVLTIYDLYATGVNGPHPEDDTMGGTDDILEADGTEVSGWTTLEFRRELDTGDTYDNVIPTTGTIPLIWAVGPSDSFTAQHVRRGGTTWPNQATVEVNTSPSWVYTGEDVEVVYWINLTVWGWQDVSHTAVHWDTTSHSGVMDFGLYPNASTPQLGEADGVYETAFMAPTEPGTVYMVIHAIVDGNHFYAAMEHMVMVKEAPTIGLKADPPAMVLVNSSGDIEWMVADADVGEITHTAIHWDTTSHGEPLDFQAYPNAILGTAGTSAGEYMATMVAPDTAGDVFFVVHAIVNGRHFYAPMEYHITVIDEPVIELVDHTDRVFVEGTAKVWWDIVGIDMGDVTHTAIHWDTTSHGEPLDFQAYPNVILGEDGSPDSDYMVMMTAPSSPATVYFVVHAIVMDTHFYAEMEYEVMVVDRPVVDLVTYTDKVFTDGTAKVWWNVTGVDEADVTHTAIHWDTTTHGEPLDFQAYPNAILGEDGSPDSDYMAMMAVPSTPTSVFFVAHAIVLGEHFYAAMEHEITVVQAPTIILVDHTEGVFVDGTVKVWWDISSVDMADVTHTAIHWDTTSHGEPLDFQAYPNAVLGEDGSPESDYMAMMAAPSSPTTVYFVAHAIVMDTHFYAEMEYMVQVVGLPMLTLVDHTERVFVDGTAKVWWDISGVDMTDVTHTAIHWDTTSHGEPMDFQAYPNAILGEDGSPDSDFMAMMTAPSSPGTVYFVAHAIVMDTHFYAEMEYEVVAVARPTVNLVDYTEWAYLGEPAKVWWDIDDVAETDLTHTAVHWDTTSYANGDMDFNDYTNTVMGGDGAPDSDFMVMFDVPESPFKVFFIVHATVLGEHFYASMEYSIDVFPKPEFNNVNFKEKVQTGDKVTVRFTIGTSVWYERISHVGVHWDTTSHGLPLDYNNYANTETVDPDINGVYEVSFEAPDKAGEVFFVIHAIVDGEDYYAVTTEQRLTVEEAEDEGSSLMTWAVIGIVVVLVIALLAFAMTRGGAGRE